MSLPKLVNQDIFFTERYIIMLLLVALDYSQGPILFEIIIYDGRYNL